MADQPAKQIMGKSEVIATSKGNTSFIPIGAAASKVVVDLATRRKPSAPAAPAVSEDIRELDIIRAKAMITTGLSELAKRIGALETVKHLEQVLAAIRGH